MKTCKQCGETLPDEAFRPYVSRGQGIRKTTVGSNTICLTCERINRSVDRIWKKETPSEEEARVLSKAALYYKTLIGKGLHPLGKYASHVCGITSNSTLCQRTPEAMLCIMDGVINAVDTYMTEFDRLLSMELTEEPDVYNDMLDEIEAKCKGPDGKVLEKYREIDLKVITRLADYEDNYKWD